MWTDKIFKKLQVSSKATPTLTGYVYNVYIPGCLNVFMVLRY